MTRMQALMGLEAMNEELKDRIRLAGGKVDDGDKEATLQDILGFGI